MAHVAGRRFADVPTGSSNAEGGGSAPGLRIEERTDMGERYVVDVTTGEKFIRGSRRADGTYRRDIRVRSDYVPVDERRAFQTRQQLSRSQRSQIPGGVIGGGGLVTSPFPPGYSGTPAAASVSRKPTGRSAAAASSAASCTQLAAPAAAGGGSDRQLRSRSKKAGASSGAPGATSVAAQQQQQEKKRRDKQQNQQQSGAGDALDVETQQLVDAVEEKLRLDGNGGSLAGRHGRDGDTGRDETVPAGGRDGNPSPSVASAPKTLEELRKRIRNVKKKLNEIATLRAKFEAGTPISEEQTRKLQRTQPLQKELEVLEEQLREVENTQGPVCSP